MTADGHDVEICAIGLVIWQHFPLMGCSPDGVVSFRCDCCPARQALLEIKCPVKVASSFSKDSPKPHYMTQIHVQMGIVGISTFDFLVYESPDVWRLLRAAFDESRFNDCYNTVKSMYAEYLFDALRAA
ncbi:hypothetical protein HPB48_021507 [Haemaphysalis longicornis]|uniref:YqaJ viral recombinase domain-containing protein n=1 Tax=Haemaphysalis longicornis TaxID=44386 RepID=A0A9J6G7S3_HAELO|nr:hypothetical protein HPB48_021507 [Haemaphysalis longicornis]